MSAMDRQEGGNHYKDMAIQPVEFITRNKIGFLEGCVIKRVCRWKAKDGLRDLRKAIHELELLIEQEERALNTAQAATSSCDAPTGWHGGLVGAMTENVRADARVSLTDIAKRYDPFTKR